MRLLVVNRDGYHRDMRCVGDTPTNGVTLDVLRTIGDLLGQEVCWFLGGAYHFALAGDWTISLTPDSAGRYRIDRCHLGMSLGTKWCRADDQERLAFLVREAAEMTPVSVA